MARTIPISNGWTNFVPSDGIILPGAEATMSICPNDAQTNARQNIAIIVIVTALPAGEAGVSTISSAAGRNAVCSGLARAFAVGNEMILSADFMDARLQSIERGITPTGANRLV